MSCVFAKQKRQRVAKFATLLQCTKKSLMGTRFPDCFLLYRRFGVKLLCPLVLPVTACEPCAQRWHHLLRDKTPRKGVLSYKFCCNPNFITQVSYGRLLRLRLRSTMPVSFVRHGVRTVRPTLASPVPRLKKRPERAFCRGAGDGSRTHL